MGFGDQAVQAVTDADEKRGGVGDGSDWDRLSAWESKKAKCEVVIVDPASQ